MRRALLVLSALFLIASAAKAQTTYNIDFTVGSGSVSGFIETNGATGVLSFGDIENWNLLLNDGTGTFDLLGPASIGANSALDLQGSSFTATSTALLFDFSNSDGSFVLFQNPTIGSGQNFLCFEGSVGDCSGNPNSLNLIVSTQVQLLSETGTQVVATAGSSVTPEPPSFVLMLGGILLAGIMFLRKR
jgi:hypothetical protein